MSEPGLLLILDDEKNDLAEVSLQLIRLGVDAVHAGSLDEADLLTRQEGSRIHGAVLPAGASDARIEAVLETIGPHTGVGVSGLAVLGPRPGDARVKELRGLGISWRLWRPYEDRDVRFLGGSLVWASSEENLRIDRRVPTALPGIVAHCGEARSVLIGDLSASGAYVEIPDPDLPPAGAQIQLEIALPGGPIELSALVRWVAEPDMRPVRARPPGCGVEFIGPSREIRMPLMEHVDIEASRFAL